MRSFILQIILGVILLIGSTPRGMAMEVIREGARADFFCAQDLGGKQEKAVVTFSDAAALPSAEISEQSNPGVEGSDEEKRQQKRLSSDRRSLGKCHFSSPFFAKRAAKGVARHPESQDAVQERTKTVRFLQQAALAC